MCKRSAHMSTRLGLEGALNILDHMAQSWDSQDHRTQAHWLQATPLPPQGNGSQTQSLETHQPALEHYPDLGVWGLLSWATEPWFL